MVRPRRTAGTDFGDHLARARTTAGLTQEELAAKLGLPRQRIDYYERLTKNPTLDFLRKAAKALGITISQLVGETPLPKKPSK